jgi:hypothetical protein
VRGRDLDGLGAGAPRHEALHLRIDRTVGRVLQAADWARSSSAAAAIGRCVTAITAAAVAGRSAAKMSWNASERT